MARDTLVSADELVQIPPDDLRRIWDDLPRLYQDALACHPKTPSRLLWHATRMGSGWISRHGYPDGAMPEDLVWEIFLFQALRLGHVSSRLAAHQSLKAEVLAVLAELGDGRARLKIAGHRNATVEVLERLAIDPERPVRRRASKRLRAGRALRRFFKNVLPDGPRAANRG